eukprot:scaffold4536_cov113-Isochrysis_galbana.AAC.12
MAMKSGTSSYKNLGRLESRSARMRLARHDEHRLDGAHAKVVVVLLGQLLRGETVELRHLVGEPLGLAKALGEEHDLGDQAVVGHHHCDGAEERLEVVGQLGAAGVAGIHRDEDAVAGIERDLASLEDEALRLHLARLLNGEDLLCNDGEHLDIDAAREETAHHLVVEAVGAVHHDALARERLGQILGRLRLAGAGGAGGRAAHPQVKRAGESHVALIGERRDDEPHRVAEVLVAVEEARVGLPDDAVVSLLFPVVAELALPLKVVGPRDAHRTHRIHGVARVHVDDQLGGKDAALQRRELRAHELHHALDAADPVLVVLQQCALVGAVAELGERVLDAEGPLDAADHDDGRRREGKVPLLLVHRGERLQARLGDGVQRRDHGSLHAHQPVLDRSLSQGRLMEGDDLAFGRVERLHLVGVVAVAKGELLERVEALHEVGLHRVRVARLREDLEQLVVGQKVEARKRAALGLEKRLEQLGHSDLADDVRRLVALTHAVLEKLVNLDELAGLGGQLLLDVLRGEDVLEVHPGALERQPLVEDLREQAELLLPLLDLGADAANEARGEDGLKRHLRVLKIDDNLVDAAQDPHIGRIAVVDGDKGGVSPRPPDLGEQLLEAVLAGGRGGRLADEVGVREDVVAQQLLHGEDLVGEEGLVEPVEDLVPMALLHRLVAEVLQHRQRLLELLHRILELVDDWIRLAALGRLVHHLVHVLVQDGHFVRDVLHLERLEVGRLPAVVQLVPAVEPLPGLNLGLADGERVAELGELGGGHLESFLHLLVHLALLAQLRERL